MTNKSPSLPATDRTRLKRLPDRGAFDVQTIYDILDAGRICHIGFISNGAPVVIPTGYARVEDRLYVHGSAASRMLKTLAQGVDACVTVTLLDGLVLARSAFHHSMNYRSVVVFGKATLVEDREEKIAALTAFTEHVLAGRWQELRPVTKQELKATSVLRLPLSEASAKVRTGPPKDEEEDYALPIWAGVLPLVTSFGEPQPDPRLKGPLPISKSVAQAIEGQKTRTADER
jgi:nitroimidazol reductase NimA-like FMN-containing flavoprotein (pyridoxamine 5'-phosphate oxidase superfamily)